MAITSEKNADRLDAMRQDHLDRDADGPLVVWLGYSVHGDEPSGANAAMFGILSAALAYLWRLEPAHRAPAYWAAGLFVMAVRQALILAGWDRNGPIAGEYWRQRDLRPSASRNDDVAVLWSHGFNDVNTKPDQTSVNARSRDRRGIAAATPSSRRSIAELMPTSALRPSVWRKRISGYE